MAISYIGGKARMGKWITPFIPTDIETYVEGFSGMFWIFFKMDLSIYPNLKTVVYNDINKLNSNLFNCAKQYDRLWDELSKYPCQQLGVENTPPEYSQMFNTFQKEIFSDDFVVGDKPNFTAAGKYIYVLTQIFSGSRPETSSYMDYKGKYRCKILVFMDKLKNPKYRESFDKITFVENMDFERVIKKYDSPKTYFYMDPPYWKTENYYSNHNFNIDDHKRLANALRNIRGKFALSYYDFKDLHDWFPPEESTVGKYGQLSLFDKKFRWETKVFKKAAASKKDGTQNDATELLILNY